MSKVPADLKYTKTHEWLKVTDDGSCVMGITDHAQNLLGDMVYVEQRSKGQTIQAGKECAVVESVKAASEVYMPVSGEITAVNEALGDGPEVVNQDPYGQGWILCIKPGSPADLKELMDAQAYSHFIESEAH